MNQQLLDDFNRVLIELKNDPTCHVEFSGCDISLISQNDDPKNERLWEMISSNINFPLILVQKLGVNSKSERYFSDSSECSFITIRSRGRNPSSQSSVNKGSDEGPVEGSPLKLQKLADFSAFESPSSNASLKQEKRVKNGIPLAKARMLLSVYSNVIEQVSRYTEADKFPSVLILCNGEDVGSTAAMFLEVISENGQLIGRKLSPVTMKNCVAKKQPNLTVPALNSSQIQCRSRYDILGMQGSGKIEVGYQGSLELEVEWRKHAGQLALLHDPPGDASAVLKAQITSGDERSAAYVIYRELEILKSIVTGLSTSSVHWIGTMEVPLVDAVKELMEQLKLGDANVTMCSKDDSRDHNLNEALDTLVFDGRKDLDFTDHLWKCLMTCTSHADLVESLQCVFTALSNGELQPMVHKTNTTPMAEMVRDSYRGQLRAPNLTGLYPLQLLADMGIEKLRQDYIDIFLSKDLTTLGHLEYFISTKPGLQERLERLEKLQNVLEMVIMLKLTLSIPQATLGASSRQMLKYYENNSIDPNHVFSFPVPTTALAKVLESCPPCEWRLEGSKTVEGISERALYHLSMHQPFEWVNVDKKSDMDSSFGDCVLYYVTHVKDNVSILV